MARPGLEPRLTGVEGGDIVEGLGLRLGLWLLGPGAGDLREAVGWVQPLHTTRNSNSWV
jgi:hypothetical protein